MDFKIFFSALAIFCCVRCHVTSALADDNGQPLPVRVATNFVATELDQLFTTLRLKEIEKQTSENLVSQDEIDGEVVVNDMADKLSKKFVKSRDHVLKLKEVIEDTWKSSAQHLEDDACCQFRNEAHEYESAFKNPIDIENMCYNQAGPDVDVKPVDRAVLKKMIDNMSNDKNLKWQHFGTQTGFHAMFPAVRMNPPNNCYNFDPRQRPWYILAMAPMPKQVVVVLDASRSMYLEKRLDLIAKDAVKKVLRMLSPTDSVGLVYFTDHAHDVSRDEPCFGEKLAVMTERNRKKLEADLDTNYKTRHGGTNYVAGLRKAYKYFTNSEAELSQPGYEDATRIILFLSDGAPSDTTPIEPVVLDRPNNTKIFTFGIGENNNWTHLEQLASLSGGQFVRVENPEVDLRERMSTFYNHIAKTEPASNKVVFSLPYLDAGGMGMVLTASAPIIVDEALVGVVGVDLILSDLVEDVSYFHNDRLSYAFVIDEFNKVIMHPLLPLPFALKTDPALVYIQELERTVSFREVLQKIQLGINGEKKKINAKRILPRGGLVSDGINVLNVPSQYSWMRVPHTKYTVVVVKASEDVDTKIDYPLSTKNYVYHRSPKVALCQHLNTKNSSRHAGIKFSLNAFKHPASYLDLDETQSEKSYMAKAEDNHYLKDGVPVMASFLSHLGQMWTLPNEITDKFDLSQHTLYRFIASSNGVFLNMPAIPLDKTYLPQTETYFRKASLRPGTIIVTPPQIMRKNDRDGVGITIARGIPRPGPKQLVDLVVGADFSLRFFVDLINAKLFTDEFSYFLLDDDGYFVYNEDFQLNKSAEIRDKVHVTERVSFIAEHLSLARVNLMRRRSCIDYGQLRERFFYELEENINIEAVGSECDGDGYSLTNIKDSNIFLGRLTRKCWERSKGCDCDACGDITDGGKCQCPCSRIPESYNICKNRFDSPSDQAQPCAPPDSSHKYAETPDDKKKQKNPVETIADKPCVKGLACELTSSTSSPMSCTRHGDCSFCSTDSRCIMTTDSCSIDTTIIIIAVVVVILVLIGSILLIVAWRKTKELKSGSTRESESESTQDTSRTSNQLTMMNGVTNGGYDRDTNYSSIYRSNSELSRSPSDEGERTRSPAAEDTNGNATSTAMVNDRNVVPKVETSNAQSYVPGKAPAEHTQPPPPLPPPKNPQLSPRLVNLPFFPSSQAPLETLSVEERVDSIPDHPPPPLPPPNNRIQQMQHRSASSQPSYPPQSDTSHVPYSYFKQYLPRQTSDLTTPSPFHTYQNTSAPRPTPELNPGSNHEPGSAPIANIRNMSNNQMLSLTEDQELMFV